MCVCVCEVCSREAANKRWLSAGNRILAHVAAVKLTLTACIGFEVVRKQMIGNG